MGGTFQEHNLVRRRKRVSKARKKELKKQRAEKVALSTRILSNDSDTMPPLNPLEKPPRLDPIIEDGEVVIVEPVEPSENVSRCVIS